jgi:hypothetical protein
MSHLSRSCVTKRRELCYGGKVTSTSSATGPIQRLIEALNTRGVSATPRQIEDARPMWDLPPLPRHGPVSDEVVDAYADLLPLLGSGRSRDQAALVCFARGRPVRANIVRDALTWRPAEDSDPLALREAPSEPPDPAEALADVASQLASAGMRHMRQIANSSVRDPFLAFWAESLRDASDTADLPVSLEDVGDQRSEPVERWVEVMARRVVGVPRDADIDDPHVTNPLVTSELSAAFPALAAVPAILEACRLPSIDDLNHEARVISIDRLRTVTQVLRRVGTPFLAQVIGESRLARVADPIAWLDRVAVTGALNALALFRHNSRLLAPLVLLLADGESMEPPSSSELAHYARLQDGDPAALAAERQAAAKESLPLSEAELDRLAELTGQARAGDQAAAGELAEIISTKNSRRLGYPAQLPTVSESPNSTPT